MNYPYVQAAFINNIREEGTKEEACNYLQEQWNETCALKKRIYNLEAYISVLESGGEVNE